MPGFVSWPGPMRQYLLILRTPHVARLFAASLLARLPMGINGLAIVLMVKAETGSFGNAGAAAGALALGTGLCAPLTARLIDARGARMLLVLAAACAAGLVAVIVLAHGGAPPVRARASRRSRPAATFPPTSSVLRAQYPRLFGDSPALLQGAFALDSVLTESIFTVAPLLTAALVVLFEPAAAIAVSAAAVLCGTAAMVAALPPGAGDATPAEHRSSGLGALAAPGIRTLVASMLPVGLRVRRARGGAARVRRPRGPAGARRRARRALGARQRRRRARLRRAARGAGRSRRATCAIALLLPLSFLPLALATSPAMMALLVIPAGVLIAPLIATRNEMAGLVAPEGARTEAYTWPLTALVAGIALGAAAAGAIADAASWQTAVLVAAVAAGCGPSSPPAAARRSLPPRRERTRADGAVPGRGGRHVRGDVLDAGDPARARPRVRHHAVAGRADDLGRDRRARGRRLVLGAALGPDRPARVARARVGRDRAADGPGRAGAELRGAARAARRCRGSACRG